MDADTEMVRGIYEAFNRDDLLAARALMQPGVTFAEPSPDTPWAGFHSGPASVMAAAFRHELELWEDFQAVPEALISTGESVVVIGLFQGVGRETGEPLCAPFLHECFVRKGRVYRMQSYPATALAARRPAEPLG